MATIRICNLAIYDWDQDPAKGYWRINLKSGKKYRIKCIVESMDANCSGAKIDGKLVNFYIDDKFIGTYISSGGRAMIDYISPSTSGRHVLKANIEPSGEDSGFTEWYRFEVCKPLSCTIRCPSSVVKGDIGKFSVIASGGVSPYTYSWEITKPDNLIDKYSIQTINYTFSQNGTYSANCTVADSCSRILKKGCIVNVSTETDKFGIKMLYPTLIGGRSWYSNWDIARSWRCISGDCIGGSDQTDPNDPEFFTGNGTGTYNCQGDGILKIGGDYPRMHIIKSDKTGYWHNVEVTVYGQRKSSLGEAWGGIMAYTRTNHYIDTNTCDTRGYSGRFKYSGEIDFEKEIRHSGPYCHAITQSGTYWSGGMPQNIWIGYKFVTYDLSDGNVKLELYIDETDGKDGGTWVKIREWTDKGDYNPNNCTGCKSGIDPKAKLTNDENRESESGYPNLAVYFRTDMIDIDDLWYKKASIREIVP